MTTGRIELEKRPYFAIIIALIWSINLAFTRRIDVNIIICMALFMASLDFFGKFRVGITDAFIYVGVFIFWYVVGCELSGAFFISGVVWIDYAIGKMLGKELIDSPKFCLPISIAAISIPLAIKGLLNYTYFLTNEITTVWPMWGEPNTGYPRTQHEFFFVITVSMIVFWMIYIKEFKWSLLGLVFSVSVLMVALVGKGRVSSCVAVVTFVLVLILYFIENKRVINYKNVVIVAVLLVTVFTVLMLCKGRVYEIVTGVNWARDGGILHNVRFLLWAEAFRFMIKNPMGNLEVQFVDLSGIKHDFAHNTWLDAGCFAGIIPFVCLMSFSIVILIIMFILWKDVNGKEKYALVAAFLGMTLYCVFEPVLNSNPFYFGAEVLLSGMVMASCDNSN